MATKTTFQNMLNEVIKAPNESRARKYLKLTKAGMTADEANNILDQVKLFENADPQANEIYADTKNAQNNVPTQLPVNNKMTNMSPKVSKGGATSGLLKKLKL